MEIDIDIIANMSVVHKAASLLLYYTDYRVFIIMRIRMINRIQFVTQNMH